MTTTLKVAVIGLGNIGKTVARNFVKGNRLVITLGAASLASSAYQSPEKSVLFYASDDITVDAEVEQLIQDNGYDAVKIGGLDKSIRIEVFGDLHEFGALGKTVTVTEARNRI